MFWYKHSGQDSIQGINSMLSATEIRVGNDKRNFQSLVMSNTSQTGNESCLDV